MSLKSKIEAVIYASEEPVTLQQLVGLLAGEAQGELDELALRQGSLALEQADASEGAAPLGSAAPEVLPEGAPSEQSLTLATDAEAPHTESSAGTSDEKRQAREQERAVRDHLRRTVETLIREYADSDRGIEVREVASGFRMGTKPEYHDAVRGFVKSLKPALKLTLPALETLAVVAYKQPVTAAEISEIRGVDSAGVLGGLLTRKLIGTAGRKQVIGRPMLYKTTRDFLLRFGLRDVSELPSMEEFERMAGELVEQEDLPMEDTAALIEQANARGDAEHVRMLSEQAEAENGNASIAADEQATETPTQEATAESAAGGKHDRSEYTEDEPAQAEAVQPAEAGEHSTGHAAGQAAEE